jgi:hypothetical protein
LADREVAPLGGRQVGRDVTPLVDNVDADDAPPARVESSGTGGADTRRGAGDDDRSFVAVRQRGAP